MTGNVQAGLTLPNWRQNLGWFVSSVHVVQVQPLPPLHFAAMHTICTQQ